MKTLFQIPISYHGIRNNPTIPTLYPNLEPWYETTPKWHGFLMRKLAAPTVWIEQRTAACDESFGRELRTERLSRVEYRRVVSLCSVVFMR